MEPLADFGSRRTSDSYGRFTAQTVLLAGNKAGSHRSTTNDIYRRQPLVLYRGHPSGTTPSPAYLLSRRHEVFPWAFPCGRLGPLRLSVARGAELSQLWVRALSQP